MKKIICIFLFICVGKYLGKAQLRVFYDSTNSDTCKCYLIGKKEYCQCYDRLGRISSHGYMKNGNRIGHWQIYSIGQLIKEGMYKHGKKNGKWKEYYLSGEELFIGEYKDDRRVGKWLFYTSCLDIRLNSSFEILRLKEMRIYK